MFAFYVRPGSALDRDALTRGNSVYFPDRVAVLPDAHLQRSMLAGAGRAARRVRCECDRNDGRKRSHSFHRILMRSAAKLELRAGAGGDRRTAG